MKRVYQPPVIKLVPLASEFSFCKYSVVNYRSGGTTTVGASATSGEDDYEE